MKKLFSLLFFVLIIGLFFYSCNEVPNSSGPETDDSQLLLKSVDDQSGLGQESVEPGSGFIVAGTGLFSQPGTIDLSEIPSGATVKQVLLYWSGAFKNASNGDNTIEVDGVTVTGESIGGPTTFFLEYGSSGPEVKFETFRKDMTTLLNWEDSPPSSVAITGMTNNIENNGAGMLIIYDDGTTSDIQLFDGQDLAYYLFTPPLDATVPITFTFAASAVDRPADLGFFAASVKLNRPNVVRVSIGGVPLPQFNSIFGSFDDPDFDSPTLNLIIPAGATSLTVQCFSEDHGTGNQPASLNWMTAALSIDIPDEDPGCNLTQGYWKTHADPNKPKKFDATWLNYMTGGVHNDFYEGNSTPSGYTYLTVMEESSSKNAYFILSQQFVAALLNKAAGSYVPTAVADALSEADSLYSNYLPADIEGLKGDDPLRKRFIDASEILDDYNNGRLGVPHCDD